MVHGLRAFLLATGWFLVCQAGPLLAAPDYWDPRLNLFCQLQLVDVSPQVAAGQGYWRLSRAEFQDEQQSGGNHHIYVRAQNASGQGIVDQKFFVSYPYNSLTINESICVQSGSPGWTCALTKAAGIDDYFGNFPMYAACPPGACGGAYNAFISETSSPAGLIGKSDKLIGMWMHNPNGTGCAAHVNFRLTFKWTINSNPTPPAISRSPASFTHDIPLGGSLPNGGFTIRNSGGGTLNYTITESIPWLSVNPTSGSSTGETDNIAIQYTVSGLSAGQHQGTITITAANASNSPQTVTVVINVAQPSTPGDFDQDGDVDQQDFGRFQACLTGPGIIQDEPSCAAARLDADVDVDQDDFGIFQRCFSGPNQPANPNCRG